MEVLRYKKGSHSDMMCCPTEDREQFIKDNAVVLVRERDETIARLRKQIRRLGRSRNSMRRERKMTRDHR